MTDEKVRSEIFWAFLRCLVGCVWLASGLIFIERGGPRNFNQWLILIVGITVPLMSLATMLMGRYRLRNLPGRR